MTYENYKMLKSEFDQEIYSDWSEWCNKNGFSIEDDGDYFITKKMVIDNRFERINELNSYLISTDYIAMKLSEVSGDAEAYSEMKLYYAEKLQLRQEARDEISELRGEF